MRNIIEKLGHKKTYWFGMTTPPLAVFVFFALENSPPLKKLYSSVEDSVLQGALPGSLMVGLIWMFFGVVIPLVVLGRIQCPKCHKKLALSFLNKESGEESPLKSSKCPHCGYDPEES